ncbi:MAG: hypothetical protein CMF50_01990 [Legionellales bacterium]|nr:hypothetical protein [Legionellales bacterium]
MFSFFKSGNNSHKSLTVLAMLSMSLEAVSALNTTVNSSSNTTALSSSEELIQDGAIAVVITSIVGLPICLVCVVCLGCFMKNEQNYDHREIIPVYG